MKDKQVGFTSPSPLFCLQFQDEPADKMKSVYGVFCSKHTEAMHLYKDIRDKDKRFQSFAKVFKISNLALLLLLCLLIWLFVTIY